jgi:hypothetical protein
VLVVFLPLVLLGCSDATNEEAAGSRMEGSKPTVERKAVGPLDIVGVENEALSAFFTKRVDVFGIDVVASEATPDDKVLHAANVMAQYLDNDEDGVPDNQALVDTMIEQQALLIMFADFDELESSGLRDAAFRDQYRMQDCEGHETNPEDGFDAAIEEVLHLISDTGYAELYPEAFGEHRGSALAEAMDLARGGYFEQVPSEYPEGAWYHYDDVTCEYGCMIAEYFYWALTSILGAQADPERCEWISNEWKPCTRELVAEMDRAVYALMTDPQYKIPTKLPDGKYRH